MSIFKSNGKPPKLLKRSKPPPDVSKVDKLPPHSLEDERGVLSCCFQGPEALRMCRAELRGGWEAFYDLRHQLVYQAITELDDRNVSVDFIALVSRLKVENRIDQVTLEYLDQVREAAPSAANLPYYLETVNGKATLRKLLAVVTGAASAIWANGEPAAETLERVERDVLAVGASVVTSRGAGAREAVVEAMAELDRVYSGGEVPGLRTGLVDLDRMTWGLQAGEMTVLAGWPGSGKTALAMNVADRAVAAGTPVLVFSLEMRAKALVMRMMSARTSVNLRAVRQEDFGRLSDAAKKIAKAPLYFQEASDLSVYQLRAVARRFWHEKKVRLVVVDYLQLLTAIGGNRFESRQQEVAEVSRGLKALARECDVAVLALSQLNDDGLLAESRKPGQDGDNVWILRHPAAKNGKRDKDLAVADAEERLAQSMELVVHKQRNGATGVVDLVFLKPYTRFESASRIKEKQ